MTPWALGALALFVFSIPSENGVSIPGIGSLSRLLGVVALGLAVASMVDRGRLRVRVPNLFLVVAVAFVGWAALTYFWSIVPSLSFSRTTQFVQLLAFAWIIHQLARTERDRDLLLQAFVLGCYVMILVAVSAFFGPTRAYYRDVVFPANSFAIVAALAIPMAWGLVMRRSFPLLQFVNTVYPLFALAAVVLAASRGGLLTAAVGLAVIPLAWPQMSMVRRATSLAVLGIATSAALMWLPQVSPELERNLERLGRVEEELIGGTMTGRTTIWEAGREVFVTSPVVGIGAGTYARAVEPILGRAMGAHNAFWSVTVTAGVIGGLLFMGMFVVVAAGLIGNAPRRIDHLVLFVALIVGTMPSNAENNKFLWFILALLATARPVMLHVKATTSQTLDRRPAPEPARRRATM